MKENRSPGDGFLLVSTVPTEIKITDPEQRVLIYFQGDFNSLSAERQSVAIAVFAAEVGVSPQNIEIYRIMPTRAV